jgi:hypothetical protein
VKSSQTIDALREFFARNGDRAFLVSEVAVAVQGRSDSESDVLDALEELTAIGEVFSRTFPVRDPHLAFSSLQFVAAVSAPVNSRQAEMHTQKAYQAWLRDWLSSHRCC